MKLEFTQQIFENPPISNFMKIRPVGAELFHMEGSTDMMKLKLTFCNFLNAPKNDNEDIQSTRLWGMY
jgi:hypothetical protein